MSRSSPKALFLDRDGVLLHEDGDYTYRVEDVELVEEVVPFLQEAQKKGYLLIVVTNQGGIAKGLYTHTDVADVHDKMIRLLQRYHITLTDMLYCPHHPTVSKCLCRKPDALLLEKAIARYGIAATHSLLIGDSPRDVEAARKTGVKGILVPANELKSLQQVTL